MAMLTPRTLLMLSFIGLLTMAQCRDSEHLCSKLETGQLDRISLKSIAFYGKKQMILFDGRYKYYIARENIRADSLPIGRSKWWDEDELSEGVKAMSLQVDTPQAVYLFALANLRFYETELLGLYVRTEKVEIMRVILRRMWPLKNDYEMWHYSPPKYPHFTVVGEQSTYAPRGFVIHKNVNNPTGAFIIYDLNLTQTNEAGRNIIVLNIPQQFSNQTKSTAVSAETPYYYLEKTDSPDKVRFVHRDNYQQKRSGTPESRSLLSSQPVGYLHGTSMVLFDQTLACVYVIENMLNSLASLDASSSHHGQVDLHLNRTNIPFEEFFKCGPEYKIQHKPNPKNRCQTRIIDDVTSKDPHNGRQSIWFLLFIIFCVIAGGFALVALGWLIKLTFCPLTSTISNPKSSGKSTKSNSTRKASLSTPPAVLKTGMISPWRQVLRKVNQALSNTISSTVESSAKTPSKDAKIPVLQT